jgi:hypothetical protein
MRRIFLVTALMLVGCEHATATKTAALPPPDGELAASRRELDGEILNWCLARKGLPGTTSACTCLADQLHIQSLPDDGARALVHVLYSVGPGSDPPFERLAPAHRVRRRAVLHRRALGTAVPSR